jgi:HD-GYP domain-containing protein (c-di-GMP phosphodiesterase class II)
MNSIDRQSPSPQASPTADLRARVVGLGEWGTRIAELFEDEGVKSRAVDVAAEVLRADLDPGRRHHVPVEGGRSGTGWAQTTRALSSDADLRAGLTADGEADLILVAADISLGAGAMLATLVKRVGEFAPDAGRLAIARLPETRTSPDRRARALVAINALLQGLPCGLLLVHAPSDSALDPGDPRAVVSRIRQLLALAGGPPEGAVRGLGWSAMVRVLSTPGFLAWREMELLADDCARDAAGWFDRLHQQPVPWQPPGYEWAEAQAVLPLVRAPRPWVESGGRSHFEQLVRDTWEEAAPCELQPALYEGEPAVAWLVSAGMPFPQSVLSLRDGIREDRARLAEKRRAAVGLIPLDEDFLETEEKGAEPDTSESEVRPPSTGPGAEVPSVGEEIVDEETAGPVEGEMEAEPEPRPPARGMADEIYRTALKLAKRILRARDLEAEVDLGEVRYALYDLLERLRADPGSLMGETFRPSLEDWFERHHVNVAILALLAADTRRGPLSDVIDLGTVAFLHDIGMLETRETWDVAMRLPPKTFERVVRPHADTGFKVLQGLGGITPSMSRIVLQEHERMDGTGYPAGLVGDTIDVNARLLAVCDTLEALSHPRPYREALPAREALARIRVLGRYTLDGDLVEALVGELEELLEEGDILTSRSA